jgi:hypothetical protein
MQTAGRDSVAAPAPPGCIALRIENISQLFDTLDPFPFPNRDLDKHAEEFIVDWARELPRHGRITILVHLPASEMQKREAQTLSDAIPTYFEYRADASAGDLRELFRVGRVALAVGLAALAVCLSASQMVAGQLGDTGFSRFVEESLIIVGWVANWRPIEIFLYDWWPIVRRRNLYRRLANADVQLKPF